MRGSEHRERRFCSSAKPQEEQAAQRRLDPIKSTRLAGTRQAAVGALRDVRANREPYSERNPSNPAGVHRHDRAGQFRRPSDIEFGMLQVTPTKQASGRIAFADREHVLRQVLANRYSAHRDSSLG